VADELEPLLAVVEAALTLLAVFEVLGLEKLVDFLAAAAVTVAAVVRALIVSGWWMTLAPPAVGVLVQYHVPLASAQLWPLGATE